MVRYSKGLSDIENRNKQDTIKELVTVKIALLNALKISYYESKIVSVIPGIKFILLFHLSLSIFIYIINAIRESVKDNAISYIVTMLFLILIHSTYLVLLSFLHKYIFGIPYLGYLFLICASSLVYLPICLIISYIGFIGDVYPVVLLTLISSSYVFNNFYYLREELNFIKKVLKIIYVILTQYLMIHFLKNIILVWYQ